jgi:hypothetical protein
MSKAKAKSRCLLQGVPNNVVIPPPGLSHLSDSSSYLPDTLEGDETSRINVILLSNYTFFVHAVRVTNEN